MRSPHLSSYPSLLPAAFTSPTSPRSPEPHTSLYPHPGATFSPPLPSASSPKAAPSGEGSGELRDKGCSPGDWVGLGPGGRHFHLHTFLALRHHQANRAEPAEVAMVALPSRTSLPSLFSVLSAGLFLLLIKPAYSFIQQPFILSVIFN